MHDGSNVTSASLNPHNESFWLGHPQPASGGAPVVECTGLVRKPSVVPVASDTCATNDARPPAAYVPSDTVKALASAVRFGIFAGLTCATHRYGATLQPKISFHRF